MPDDTRDLESDEQYCTSCGKIISKKANFCPDCGETQSSIKGRTNIGVLSNNPIDKLEIITISFSLLVFLGAFLNWGGNPLASVTGLGAGVGYLTVVLSLVIVGISYYNVYDSKRMFAIFLLGAIVLALAILFLNRIVQVESARTGGGLLLTLAGGLGILVSGILGYASYTSTRRAIVSVMALVILTGIVAVGGSALIHQERVSQVEIQTVAVSPNANGGEDIRVYSHIHNPTNAELEVTIKAKVSIHRNSGPSEFNDGEVHTLSKTVTISPDSTRTVLNTFTEIDADGLQPKGKAMEFPATEEGYVFEMTGVRCSVNELPCQYEDYSVSIEVSG